VDEDTLDNVDKVLCLHKRTAVPYGVVYRRMKPKAKADNDREEIKQYTNFVGAKCAQRMLICRN